MSTHIFTRNLAGDIVGTFPLDAVPDLEPECRHGKSGFCPYCHECGEGKYEQCPEH